MRPTPPKFLLPLLLLCIAADAPPDLSTPTAAAKAFFRGVRIGNVDAAEQACILNADDLPLLTAMVNVRLSRVRLEEAADIRFGKQDPPLVPPDDSDLRLDDAPVVVNGASAVLTLGDTDLDFKKINNQWQLDFSELNQRENLAQSLPDMIKMAQIGNAIALDIQNGKFTTPDEARQSLANQLSAALTPTTPTSQTSQPATIPTTNP